MCWPRPSVSARRRGRQAGFTLIELMVGIVIGLLASLAVTQVLVSSEGQKRAITSASDAQVNGALALSTLQRAFLPAGYGFAANPAVIGCTLTAVFNGNPITSTVADFPQVLAPVTITQGTGDEPDSIRILASGKSSFSVPLRVVAPGYNPANPLLNQQIPVSSVRSVEGPRYSGGGAMLAPGDLMVAAISSTQPCEVFRVTADPTGPFVPRADDPARWNPLGHPAQTYGEGNLLINLGEPVDVTYSIANNALVARTLRLSATGTPSYDGPVELFPEIVQLQALYGKDTDNNGVVDAWNVATPTSNAEWRQVIAVRVALVARSAQFEKEDVTLANPQWDVGNAITIAGTVACGASQCLPLVVDTLTDWKRYRYRVFDAIVPLRNMLWSA